MLTNRIQRLETHAEAIKSRLEGARSKRLTLGFLIFGLLVASQIVKGYGLELIALFLITPVFIYFFKKSNKIAQYHSLILNRISFYQRQEAFLAGNLVENVLPETMFNPDLARDLDLGVLYSALNFCFSQEGEDKLNNLLCQNFTDDSWQARHNKIKELASYPGPLRNLQTDIQSKVSFDNIQKEIERSFFPEPMPWKWIVPISWALTLVFLFTPGPAILWKVSLFIYMGSMLSFLSQTKFLFSRLQDLHHDFESLNRKVHNLEHLARNLSFASSLKNQEASKDTRILGRLISLMSLRTNPILFYILNLTLPWDFFLSFFCEKARLQFAKHFTNWSQEAKSIDAFASLANLKLYQNTKWPELGTNNFIETQDLAHPLLNQKTVVTNSFSPKEHRVFIITGSNMSGKSTFLRALGVNYCLANIGAPVFAQKFLFKSMKIVTCIRVSDSLRDGQSYFYAEVQRMKKILTAAKKEPLFFLIDEPLRGTNNKERLIGNQSYLKQMLESQGQGFLCTHDLELTQLADDSPLITNFHFSEQWEDQDLSFDYKIKDGPSQSTNALKILEKEGLYQSQSL